MNNRIIIISGPTASGKTSIALDIAGKYNGELISADSRQIYKGMDIGTGKDHPDDTKIHLIDIIDPNQSFSAAQYRREALKLIEDIKIRGKLPIIVGGTGLYIDALINPKDTYSVKPKFLLRFFLNKLSVAALQRIYCTIDRQSFMALNNSDRHNPHRLIRKIEIAMSLKQLGLFPGQRLPVSDHYLHLSLTAPNDYLFSKVDKRVEDRLNAGLLDEIKSLLKKYSWSHPGLNTLAYKQFKPFFDHKDSLASCVDRWRYDEHAYVRRQKTWFKKIANVRFVDITNIKHKDEIDGLVQKFLTNTVQ